MNSILSKIDNSALITAAILKVAGRCNLNCTYCYMYNLEDSTHQLQPVKMSDKTINDFFSWLESYLFYSGLDTFQFSIHGGEPLMVGKDLISYIGERRKCLEEKTGIPIKVTLLTNGLLLDDEWIEVFRKYRIKFGISIDGPAKVHNRWRLDKKGNGSHAAVEDKIRWILESPKRNAVFSSVLCVLNPDVDGRELLHYFYELGLSGVDFLLPDQNHTHGCPGFKKPDLCADYGKVLAEAYLAWRKIDDPRFHVRKFDMLLRACFGDIPTLDSLGTGPITVFTIETDGGVEPVDVMKACGNGFTKANINISEMSGSDVFKVPLIKLGLEKTRSLPLDCEGCRNVSLCGGGYLPHRFSIENGFENKTVYCADMMRLCDVIVDDVVNTLMAAKHDRLK